ncbi:hypothetical protein HYW20_06425 [Candidatus Woesearchaeota archaeon]|nr:hypothetical protein [Candidatus Woesearchaeota archaeon]
MAKSMGESRPAKSFKGQSSLEYVMIVALTFLIVVPTTYLFYSYSKESSQEISDAQVTKLGRGIIDASESIFYSGQGSKTVLELNVPDRVQGAKIIDGRELVFTVSSSVGDTELVFFSSVLITTTGCSPPPSVCQIPQLGSSGFKKVKVEAITANAVTITTI